MSRSYGSHGVFAVAFALCFCVVAGALAQSSGANARFVVAQLERGVPSELRAGLASAGYRELRVLPGQRLLLERVASAREQAQSLYGLPLTPFAQSARISAELLQPSATGETLPVLIHTMPGSSGEAVVRWLAGAGLPQLGMGQAGDALRISTRMPSARAAELAALEEVFFVERIHHLGLFNDRSAGSIQSGTQGVAEAATPIWAKGLRGEGQIVGLIDTGVDADACWYSGASEQLPKTNTWSQAGGYGKEVDATHSTIIAYDFLYSCDQFASASDCDDPAQARSWDSNGHGTHCSGSMVGHRESGGNNGMAPAAKLVAQDAGYKVNDCADLPGVGCPVVDLYPIFEQAYAQGVRIHNNSYGDNENAPTPQPSNYTARSQDVDRFMWDHKDMLVVFAAGNSGEGNAEFSVSSPSTNKNGLSVGSARTMPAANSDEDLSSFSSRGWSADGRVKPDLIAPGCNTSAASDRNNTSHNCAEDSGCGTSYSAPILVGAAALVRQYLSEGFYPSGAKNAADTLQPTAALLKGVLVNSAVSMSGRDNNGQAITAIPSNEQGWGRIQLDRTLLFQGASRKLYLDDHKVGFATGATDTLEYSLTDLEAGEALKVTLVWTDFPGTPDAAPRMPKLDDPASFNAAQLVNDLDLELSDGNSTYLGNVFSDGKSETGGAADRRNNVEQVLIAQPSAGNWSVRVKANSITKESQDFALVITGKWASAGPRTEPPATQPQAAGAAAQAGSAAGTSGRTAASASASATAPTNDTATAGTPGSTMNSASASTTTPAAGASLAQSTQAGATASAAETSDAPKDSGGCSVAITRSAKLPSWALWASVSAGLLAGRRRWRCARCAALDGCPAQSRL